MASSFTGNIGFLLNENKMNIFVRFHTEKLHCPILPTAYTTITYIDSFRLWLLLNKAFKQNMYTNYYKKEKNITRILCERHGTKLRVTISR